MNKSVLITGASKGIGRALAKKMLAENYRVIGTSRTGTIEGFENKNFVPLKLDLSDPESIENINQTVVDKFKPIDIIINNAGIGPDLFTQKPELNTFDKTFDVNVRGTVFLTELLIDSLNNKGMIVNVSSKMGSIDECKLDGSVAYRMSKSALNMYTKILANRLKDTLKVASIHPGYVKTTIAESNIENGRLTPEQAADNMYRFILSDFQSGVFWDSETDTVLPC